MCRHCHGICPVPGDRHAGLCVFSFRVWDWEDLFSAILLATLPGLNPISVSLRDLCCQFPSWEFNEEALTPGVFLLLDNPELSLLHLHLSPELWPLPTQALIPARGQRVRRPKVCGRYVLG